MVQYEIKILLAFIWVVPHKITSGTLYLKLIQSFLQMLN